MTHDSLRVQVGDLQSGWILEATGVTQFQLLSNPSFQDRIGVLEGGTLFVKQGGPSTIWVREADGVARFSLSGNRIAVLEGTTLLVKEGDLSTPWVREADGVAEFEIYADRIAALEGGTLFVKEGSLNASWVQETATGVSSFALDGSRIAVLEGATLFVKEHGLSSSWVREADGVSAFEISGDRIGVLEGGTLLVKEGSLSSSWVQEATGVSSFRLSGDRIGILKAGEFLVKQGDLSSTWVDEAGGVSAFQLHGGRIAVLTGSALQVKENGLSTPWTTLGVSVSRFQLSGDVQSSVLTQHNDNQRTGVQASEKSLTPARLRAQGMMIKYVTLDGGNANAQPLYLHHATILPWGSSHAVTRNVLFVINEANELWAIDANTGAPLWIVSLLDASPAQRPLPRGWNSMPPTPIIDPSANTIYVAFSTKNQQLDALGWCKPQDVPGNSGCYTATREADLLSHLDVAFWLVALDTRTGAELRRVRVSATWTRPNGTTVDFDPRVQNNRPALLLDHGSIYLAFGETQEGMAIYHGWIVRYDASTFTPMGSFCTTPNFQVTSLGPTPAEGGGIWAGGGGLAADHLGTVYALVGNAPFDPATQSYGDSFIGLTPTQSGVSLSGAYTDLSMIGGKTITALMDTNDLDLGAGGPIVVPGTSTVIGGGKTGRLYVVDGPTMVSLEGFQAYTNTYHPTWNYGCPQGAPSWCESWESGPHLHGSPSYWRYHFYAWAEKDFLKSFAYDPTHHYLNPSPTVAPIRASETTMPGGLTSISADGDEVGTGIVWAIIPSNDGSYLYAFDASSLELLWNAALPGRSVMSHNAAPTIADGTVFIVTQLGTLVAYKLAPLNAAVQPAGRVPLMPFAPPALAERGIHTEHAILTATTAIREQLAPPDGEWQLFSTRAARADSVEEFEGGYRRADEWIATDGSSLRAVVQRSVNSPTGGAPPWQLYRVTEHRGRGRLARVSWIARTETSSRSSTYTFFGRRPFPPYEPRHWNDSLGRP